MMPMHDAVLRKKPELLSAELSGEEVILNPASGDYFTLNDVGRRVWELVDGQKSQAQLTGMLAREYEVEPEVLRRDLQELIDDLLDNGLLELV
jgi:hypothetical protein